MVNPDRPLAAYDATRNSVIETSRKQLEKGDEPEVVAQVVLKAAQELKPRLRYPACPVARQVALMRRILPEGLFNSILRKQVGLPE